MKYLLYEISCTWLCIYILGIRKNKIHWIFENIPQYLLVTLTTYTSCSSYRDNIILKENVFEADYEISSYIYKILLWNKKKEKL